jgi:hypothetical protein
VEILNASPECRRSVTISYDEKPGIQAHLLQFSFNNSMNSV